MTHITPKTPTFELPPPGATAALVLANGKVLWGRGVGAATSAEGEVVFSTGMTGYQETLTDLSFAGQIVTFTFPHIGNVGANPEDVESLKPAARGMIVRADITDPSNWRSIQDFDSWLKEVGIPGIAGIDTRALTRSIREDGPPNGVIIHEPSGKFDLPALWERAHNWPGLTGMDLAKEVTCKKACEWTETAWRLGQGFGTMKASKHHLVAIDFGAKRNILRALAELGCRITVLPATATAEQVFSYNPDGVFLSNGPGDPAPTGEYAGPTIRAIIEKGLPLFGICLGHQLLGLALGGKTAKLPIGHRGANHPVKDLATGKVEITSQNHGFAVVEDSLPEGVKVSHRSLFDGTVEGLVLEGKPVFSVQYHPEASPGPNDAHYLFRRFIALMER